MGSNFLSPSGKRSVSGLTDPNPFPPNGYSKRARSSKHQPPPLTTPTGHVAFRLLCNASRIGGVIGKSGSVIKSLQQSTGAKIRVDDAPSESPDRVIVIVASSSLVGKVILRSYADHHNGEVVEVSNAQEALLKVFERILEVAAGTEGIELGDRVVSCRLVVDAAQAGSVIGKGGNVVERIKKDTGCRVRVFADNLPSCLSSSDEVIEIEGNVSSVKKALVAVSRCLQDCHPSDRTKMMGSKPYEVVHHEDLVAVPREALTSVPRETSVGAPREVFIGAPRETLTDLQVDHFLQRHSALSNLPSSSNSYATGLHSMSAEVNRISSLEPKALQKEITFRILCSNDRIGGIIGKGGGIVRALQSETGATISIGPSVAACEDRLITITASENPESRYSPTQKAAVLVFSRSVETGIEKGLDSGFNTGSSVTAQLVVPSNQVGCLLGKGGVIVSEMRKTTGASIRIIGADQVPKCASDSDQIVQISGEFSNVQDALYNATGRLRDNLFASTQNSAGTGSLSSVQADTSPYGRLRDVVPHGGQPAVGISHSLSRHTFSQGTDHLALARNFDHPSSPGLRTNTFSQGIDHLAHTRNFDHPSSPGLRTHTFSQGIDHLAHTRNFDHPSSPGFRAHTFSQGIDHLALTRSFDHSSSPGLRKPPAVAGINSRSINDVSWGLAPRKGALELVSGSKSAIVTNTTVEIVVPEDTLDLVYGENGSNLARLRQISGAKVVIHQPRPGTSDRTIIISGSPDETQAAQSLLQAFILNGSS